VRYLTGASPRNYQPANISFDLLPPLPDREQPHRQADKKARRVRQCQRALAAVEEWLRQCSPTPMAAD
jgi:methylenetetrahydrofolate--tRNA-(uracil-5-)-methyltransferase